MFSPSSMGSVALSTQAPPYDRLKQAAWAEKKDPYWRNWWETADPAFANFKGHIHLRYVKGVSFSRNVSLEHSIGCVVVGLISHLLSNVVHEALTIQLYTWKRVRLGKALPWHGLGGP